MSTDQLSKDLFTLNMNHEAQNSFQGLFQWVYYSAVIGFASIGVSVLTIILNFGNGTYEQPSGGSSLVGTLFGLAISIFLNLTLWAASTRIRKALLHSEQSTFNEGLSKFALYFRVIGILAIVVLVIFVLALIIGIIAGLSR